MSAISYEPISFKFEKMQRKISCRILSVKRISTILGISCVFVIRVCVCEFFFYKTEVSAARVTTDAPWPGDDRLLAGASMAFGAALQ